MGQNKLYKKMVYHLRDTRIITPVMNQIPSKTHLVLTHRISPPQQFPGFRSATITIPYMYTVCGLRGLFSQLARKNGGHWAPCRACSCQQLVRAMSSFNCYNCYVIKSYSFARQLSTVNDRKLLGNFVDYFLRPPVIPAEMTSYLPFGASTWCFVLHRIA